MMGLSYLQNCSVQAQSQIQLLPFIINQIYQNKQAIMKYFLSIIWKFFKQIPKNVGKLIKLSDSEETAPSSSSHIAPLSIRVKRRRRKTFKSFLRDESSSRIRRKKLARERRRSLKSDASYKNGQSSSISMSLEDNSEIDQKDCFTNEVKFVAIQLEPPSFSLFQDNNGLQISIINPNRPEQIPSRLDQSDQELLELFTGAHCKQKENARVNRQKQVSILSSIGKPEKQWWQFVLEQRKSHKQLDQHNQIQKAQGQRQQNHMKVIKMIDLVEDQNFPKEFTVPLSICQQ